MVNHLAQPTAVHWHGIELQSYPRRRARLEWSPGSAHAARCAGRFVCRRIHPTSRRHIHLSHPPERAGADDLGLYGPLIVLEPGTTFDPATDHIVIVSPDGPSTDTPAACSTAARRPEPILDAGRKAHRLRLINIHGDYRVLFTLESSGGPWQWRQLAKDGAAVATGLAGPQPARLLTGPGETADFEAPARHRRRLGPGRSGAVCRPGLEARPCPSG